MGSGAYRGFSGKHGRKQKRVISLRLQGLGAEAAKIRGGLVKPQELLLSYCCYEDHGTARNDRLTTGLSNAKIATGPILEASGYSNSVNARTTNPERCPECLALECIRGSQDQWFRLRSPPERKPSPQG